MEEKKQKEEEITIDLGKVKDFFTKGKKEIKKEEQKTKHQIEKEEKKIESLESEKENISEKEEKIEEQIEEEKEKLEALEGEEAELKEEETELEKEAKDIMSREKEIEDDVKKAKNVFSGKEKIEKKETQTKSESSFDIKKIGKFLYKYRLILLLLIPIFFSIFFRAYPVYLPITDDWARDTIYNNVQNSINKQVLQQYPNLPDKQKAALAQKEFNDFISQNEEAIEKQVEQTSEIFKQKMKDEDGQTYLLAIDPWLAYGYAKNYVENGHFGNTLVNDSISWYSLRNGREGRKANFRFLPFLMAMNYKIMNIFTEVSLLTAAFYIPLILTTLAAIAMFFIGKKIGGYAGALTASIIFAVHAGLLTRTAAGFSDTDSILILFGVLSVMFFVLAFEEKEKKNYAYSILAGLSMAFYFIGHGASWWHIFDTIIGAAALYLVYQIWINKKEFKKGIKDIFKTAEIKKTLTTIISFSVSTFLFGGLLRAITGRSFIAGIKSIMITPFSQPLNFLAFKDVGTKSVWPNVMTTVAELNKSSVSGVISQLGGKFFFALAVAGIIYLFVKKKDGERKHVFYGLLVAIWFTGTIFTAKSSLRFIELVIAPFAIAIAALVTWLYNDVSRWTEKEISLQAWISKIIVVALLLIVVFAPILKSADAVGRRELPSMNDAWYESLIGIKDASDDAIITSWWDFGHWFVAVAQRRVTFDGGDQGERIHWVGKSLLTSDETESIGILRMLNCGQEKAPHVLEKYLDNDTVKAVDILNEIMVKNKNEARLILEKESLTQEAIEEVLDATHCEDLIEQYYITSDDMVGKAGVWGHFGSWNFTKASMYNKVNRKKKDEGVKILIENFSLNEETAGMIYHEIKTEDADRWISPWPGYRGESSCSVNDNVVTCGNGLGVDLDTYEAKINVQGGTGIPASLVYAEKEGIKEKKFNNGKGISAALIPNGNSYRSVLMDPLQADSMFTKLFYFEGHGLECFDLFSYKQSFKGDQIYVWKVDWNCKTKNVIEELEEDQNTEPVIPVDNSTVNESGFKVNVT